MSILVVFSMDFTITRSLGVIGVARARGLKLRSELTIRFDMPGLVRTNIDKQFNVASTTKASLASVSDPETSSRLLFSYLLSCRMLSMRSIRPVASASRVPWSSDWWFEGILSKETSKTPPYCQSI